MPRSVIRLAGIVAPVERKSHIVMVAIAQSFQLVRQAVAITRVNIGMISLTIHQPKFEMSSKISPVTIWQHQSRSDKRLKNLRLDPS